MNYAVILSAGVGQRMRSSGKPKQFLEVYGKPVVIHTLRKFDSCMDIDKVIVCCGASWMDYMNDIIRRFEIKKVEAVIPGGSSRQSSVINGVKHIEGLNAADDDIVVIHDGVRPLVDVAVISENVRAASQYGAAATVYPASESVVVTSTDEAGYEDFRKRDDTYNLTSPQSFRFDILKKLCGENSSETEDAQLPALDSAIAYAANGGKVHLVRENNHNIKITTPEDYYMLKALLELEENKSVFGIG